MMRCVPGAIGFLMLCDVSAAQHAPVPPGGKTPAAPRERARSEAEADMVFTVGGWESGVTRLLVFTECSPEHCWSEGQLQWVRVKERTGRGTTRHVERMIAMREIAYGTFVLGAQVRVVGVERVFDLLLTESHGPGPTRVLRLKSGEPGKYEATELTAQAADN